jgi:hypothetical protein
MGLDQIRSAAAMQGDASSQKQFEEAIRMSENDITTFLNLK